MWALRGVSGTFRREQRGGGCQVHSTQDTRSKARPRGSVSVGTSWKAHPLSRRHFSILTAGVRVGLDWGAGGRGRDGKAWAPGLAPCTEHAKGYLQQASLRRLPATCLKIQEAGVSGVDGALDGPL